MTRELLMRGMLAGLAAAFLAVLFARLVGEPQVDLAVGFEAARARALGAPEEAELVSRALQRGLGLFTAIVLYGAAGGGLFSVVFALVYGRVLALGPRTLALLLAALAFVCLALIPALKYPPGPPGVGKSETIDYRTTTYFGALALSLAAMAAAVHLGRLAGRRFGALNGALMGAAAYGILAALALLALPRINEVPPGFPADVLWSFRVASLGIQAVLWSAIGVLFGLMAEHVLQGAALRRGGASPWKPV